MVFDGIIEPLGSRTPGIQSLAIRLRVLAAQGVVELDVAPGGRSSGGFPQAHRHLHCNADPGPLLHERNLALFFQQSSFECLLVPGVRQRHDRARAFKGILQCDTRGAFLAAPRSPRNGGMHLLLFLPSFIEEPPTFLEVRSLLPETSPLVPTVGQQLNGVPREHRGLQDIIPRVLRRRIRSYTLLTWRSGKIDSFNDGIASVRNASNV